MPSSRYYRLLLALLVVLLLLILLVVAVEASSAAAAAAAAVNARYPSRHRHRHRHRNVVEFFFSHEPSDDDAAATDTATDATGGADTTTPAGADTTTAAAAPAAPPSTVQTRNMDKSIMDILSTVPEMSTFFSAMKRANLLPLLEEELVNGNAGTTRTTTTLIIPINDAFDDTKNDEYYDLLTKILWWPEWRLHLKDLLLHHIYMGSFLPLLYDNETNTAATQPQLLSMANGETVSFVTENNNNNQNDHNSVIMLFNNEPMNIMAYYELANGYIYTTDSILFPSFVRNTIIETTSSSSSTTAAVITNASPNPSTTSTDSSSSSSSTQILMELLVIAGLTSELNLDNAAYTLFAPTDAAFVAAIQANVLSSWRLSASSSSAAAGTAAAAATPKQLQELKRLLKYHIVPGVYASTSFLSPQDNNNNNKGEVQLVSMSSQPISIRKSLASVNNGRTMLHFNDSPILVATSLNHLAKNGIVHVISQVLIPPTTTTTTISNSLSLSLSTTTILTSSSSPPPKSTNDTTTTTTPALDTISASSTTSTTTATTITLADILLDTPELQIFGEALVAIGLIMGHHHDNNDSSSTSSSTTILGGRYYDDDQLGVVDAANNAAVLPMSSSSSSTSSSYTVFAPENQAFANNGLVNLYFDDPHGYALHLHELFTFHIAQGIILSSDLHNNRTIQMLNHQVLTVEVEMQEEEEEAGRETILLRPTMNNDDETTILTPNLMAQNGVVHVINSILLPPFALETLWTWSSRSTPMFTMLIEAAEMRYVLKTKSSITVFAPSDDAIDKLGAATVAFLLSAEGKSSLIDLVSYHIVDSLHPSTLIISQQQQQMQVTVSTMLMGRHLDIQVKTNINGSDDGGKGIILVNAGAAQVTAADNLVSNGIIHVIDTVLEVPTTTTTSISITTEPVISNMLGSNNQESSSASSSLSSSTVTMVATVAAATSRILFLLFATALAAAWC